MEQLFNRSADLDKRRMLAREAPPAERYVWMRLRNRQVSGLKFRRQHGVGCYILDFYCPARRLAVEIDGDSHDSEAVSRYDRKREQFLESLGIRVVRFTNRQVFQNLNLVIEQIAHTAES